MAPRLRMLLLLLPAGCAAPGTGEEVTMRQALENGRASLEAVSPVAIPAGLAAAAPPPPRPALARRGILPSAMPHTPPATAAELLGAGPDALRRRLGEPAFRRAEGGAEVWLYAGQGCALDLVLYPEGRALRVAHAEARASGAEALTEAACLRGIAGSPASPPFAAGAGEAPGPRESGI